MQFLLCQPLMDSGGHTRLGSAEPEGQPELFIAKWPPAPTTHPPLSFFLSSLSPSHFLSPSLSLSPSVGYFATSAVLQPHWNDPSRKRNPRCVCVWVYTHTPKCLCADLTCIIFCKFNQPSLPTPVLIFRFSYCFHIPQKLLKYFVLNNFSRHSQLYIKMLSFTKQAMFTESLRSPYCPHLVRAGYLPVSHQKIIV